MSEEGLDAVLRRKGYAVHADPVHADWKQREAARATQHQATLLELRALTFVLPLPPSVNDLYGVNLKTGQKFLVPEQREFRSRVIGAVRFQMQRTPMLVGRLESTAKFYLANRRRLDISNCVKALDDALVHAKAMRDDCLIDAAHQYRVLIADDSDERTEITLQEIG